MELCRERFSEFTFCALEKGHEGNHKAYGNRNLTDTLLTVWPNKDEVPKPPCGVTHGDWTCTLPKGHDGYHNCTDMRTSKTYAAYENEASNDTVNSPSHYKTVPEIECIRVVEHFNFNRGNAIKYVWRAGEKSKETEIEDLKKAVWYLQREIERLCSSK